MHPRRGLTTAGSTRHLEGVDDRYASSKVGRHRHRDRVGLGDAPLRQPNPLCFFRAGGAADLPRGGLCAYVAPQTHRRGTRSCGAGAATLPIANNSGDGAIRAPAASGSFCDSADALTFAAAIEIDSRDRTRFGARGRLSSHWRAMEDGPGRFIGDFISRETLPTFEPSYAVADFDAAELTATGITIYRLDRHGAPTSILGHWAYPADPGSIHLRGGP